ncbi:uncharacterized protein VP01_3116g2 [Puccinia sorghi]|uniref:Uncharacterized protein n=1 Tax=Puccinia sorghi TaxID=27349 RepID=A0A0L6V056_9BASI|nr:uncharacterized protein VP01_3116g2 [Puccinia sorghi]
MHAARVTAAVLHTSHGECQKGSTTWTKPYKKGPKPRPEHTTPISSPLYTDPSTHSNDWLLLCLVLVDHLHVVSGLSQAKSNKTLISLKSILHKVRTAIEWRLLAPKDYSTKRFQEWLITFIQRDRIKDLLQKPVNYSNPSTDPTFRHCIWDGSIWSTSKGCDRELYHWQFGNLLFGIYVNWFNPQGNMVLGKHKSPLIEASEPLLFRYNPWTLRANIETSVVSLCYSTYARYPNSSCQSCFNCCRLRPARNPKADCQLATMQSQAVIVQTEIN